MKKTIFLALSVVAVAVLAVSFSGCLATGDDKPVIIDNPASIQSITYYTPVDSDKVTAEILVQIQGTHSQSVDKENITVTVSGNNIFVNVPVVNSSPVNTMDLGYEAVEVVLGNGFKDGEYNVIVNTGTDKEVTSVISFENGELSYYKPGSIGDVVIGTDGSNITVDVNVVLGGSAETIDKDNITVSDEFKDGELEICIPVKVTGSFTTLNLIFAQESFVIGQLDQFEDGTYFVTVNGVTAGFTIEDGKLTAIE